MPAWWDRLTGNKRWGSTSTIEEPTDAQANQGFAFLGTVPPSAQLHDAVFQYLDDKDYWLYQQIHVVINSEGITEAFGDYNSLLAALDSRYVLGPAPVLSVSGKNGVVTLVVGDVSGAAPLASPVFSGAPTTPTPAVSDDSLKVPNTSWVRAMIGDIPGSPVISVAGKTGAVLLVVTDVSGAAPLASPAFTGTPTVPTQAVGNNSTRAASTAFVLANLPNVPVQSVAGKTGTITLVVGDVSGAAPLASPVFTGNPTAPTPLAGDSDTSVATTGFVTAAIAAIPGDAVDSVAGKTGNVTLVVGDVSGAAPLASPTFTGDPKAPTPAAGDSDTSVATTAFVMGAKASNETAFLNSGTWVAPAGVTKAKVRMWGGGGGGGGSANAGSAAAGGGAGEYREGVLTVTPGTSYTVTVGAAAGTSAAGAVTGNNGGTSSFAALMTADGGSGGGGASGGITQTVGPGGSGGVGGFGVNGRDGGLGFALGTGQICQGGGGAPYGGAFGSNSVGAAALNGATGIFPGGGGNGGIIGGGGGAGGKGLVLVEW